MKLDIDGLFKGRDMGYSRSHPDTNRYIQACFCEEPHCHLPGEDSEQRHDYACLMMAALEMYELLEYIRDTATIETPTDVLERVNTLLAKIEGGGDDTNA